MIMLTATLLAALFWDRKLFAGQFSGTVYKLVDFVSVYSQYKTAEAATVTHGFTCNRNHYFRFDNALLHLQKVSFVLFKV